MNHTASAHRVARRWARIHAPQTWKLAGLNSPNTLSVEIPLAGSVRDWAMVDDPYGRDYDKVLEDLIRAFHREETRGNGVVDAAKYRRGEVTLYVEYPSGSDEDLSLVDLQKFVEKHLKETAQDDAGVKFVLYGPRNRAPVVDPEVEIWEN